LKTLLFSILALVASVLSLPAYATITIYQPANNSTVSSPFTLTASSATCGGKTTTSMGYEIDNGMTIIEGTSFTVSVTTTPGAHTLKVKCWAKHGVNSQTAYSIVAVVLAKAAIPSNAVSVSGIQTMSNWRTKVDPATGGSAVGQMTQMLHSPSYTGQQQTSRFDTSYSDYGGVLYSVTYGNDTASHNFVYDAEVWIASGSVLGNLEMDNNQVTANGDTIIYAFQCAGNSGVWEYTRNAGTPAAPIVDWVKSNQPCDPMTWATNTWHHIQIATSRDDNGNVTYHSVFLDGTEYPINETVMSDFQLKWAPVLIANFQVDGNGASSGASTLYVDNLTLYRW
jgi:hypothetical protein